MRFVVFGAGAVGGVLGARLSQHGHEVVLIARGPHLDAIRDRGLRIESHRRRATLRIAAVGHADEAAIGPDDVVVLAVKSQDTATALDALAAAAPADTPVICAQNGVANERMTSERFSRVYAMSVLCPTSFLVPGVVRAHSSPITGVLDLGCHPEGVDEVAEAVAVALGRSKFASVARPDIMRWKYTKLVTNLGNAIEAVCGTEARHGPIDDLAKQEAWACFQAAGIDTVSMEEYHRRLGHLIRQRKVRGELRAGGSTWQTLARGSGTIETDYLNGEIVDIGRRVGVPTPVNAALQRWANQLARDRLPPEALSEDEFLAELDAASG